MAFGGFCVEERRVWRRVKMREGFEVEMMSWA